MHSCAPFRIIQCTRDISYNPSDLNHLLQNEEIPQNKWNHIFAHHNMYICGILLTLFIHIHRNGMITLGKVVIILLKLYYKILKWTSNCCQFKMLSQHAVLTYITTKNFSTNILLQLPPYQNKVDILSWIYCQRSGSTLFNYGHPRSSTAATSKK